ncbi:MAG: PfkB family carbohydrate kinase [Planctomycetota bacterium]|nr:PfkB family carbohydrate kinase [Planctomycetota bacterium]
MSLLVTGSIGIDTVEAPSGRIEDALGGSSVYFAQAASFFTPVRLVGVIGDDCPNDFLKPLQDNPNIDLAGLEVRRGSRTFRWHGRYHDDINVRDTVQVELNVLAEAGPVIPEQFTDSEYVFLANTHPSLQIELLGQLSRPKFVVADTMDLWIETERETLSDLLGRIDGLVLNDSEAKLLAGEPNLVATAERIADMVRCFVVVKKGEHGSLLFADGRASPLPAYPAAKVIDPTGAGDSFAGAMMGYLAAVDQVDLDTLRRALAYGTVTASFCLEDFSLNRLRTVTRDQVETRMAEFEQWVSF